MSNPKTLKVSLAEFGYYMEVDVSKWDCSREPVHWHLCKNGKRIGQIWVSSMTWKELPDVSSSIEKEARRLTQSYSSEITAIYHYNKENGAD